MASPLANKSLLVTGGTGSFGKAYVRHALDVGARRVAILSRDEGKQWVLRHEWPADERLRWMVGDVTDPARMTTAMRDVDIVVHAAALKHVPVCEEEPREARRVNIEGSATVAAAAIAENVERAVFLSTDKAAAPNTQYGKTKAVAEGEWIQSNVYAAGRRTRLVATRYGNVIGSRGSVLPLFRAQAARGEPLTITDPAMTRFWMRMTGALRLVDAALTYGRGGEVFVPKAPSASIVALAQAVAPTSQWRATGIRRSEKVHEVLITEDEARSTYDPGNFYVIEPRRTWEYLPPPPWDRVEEGFSYRSDNNPDVLDVEALRALLDDAHD